MLKLKKKNNNSGAKGLIMLFLILSFLEIRAEPNHFRFKFHNFAALMRINGRSFFPANVNAHFIFGCGVLRTIKAPISSASSINHLAPLVCWRVGVNRQAPAVIHVEMNKYKGRAWCSMWQQWKDRIRNRPFFILIPYQM